MKRLIITRKQLCLLNEINDTEKTVVNATAPKNELGAKVQDVANDIIGSGAPLKNVNIDARTPTNKADDNKEVNIAVDMNGGSLQNNTNNAIRKAEQNNINTDNAVFCINGEDATNPTIGEGRRFTKKDIERARLYEMRKNGTVFKKGMLSEGRPETAEANKIVKRLYNAVEKYTRGKYQDSDWHSLNQIFDAMRTVPGVREVSVNGGKYHGFFSDSPCKKYNLSIGLECGEIIGGELTCHAAGTVSEPFSSYDVTCSFWRNSTQDKFYE